MSLQKAHNNRYTYTRECCGRRQNGDEGRPEKKCYKGVIKSALLFSLSSLQDYRYQTDHYLFKHLYTASF